MSILRTIRLRPLFTLLFLSINLVYVIAIVMLIYVYLTRFIVQEESETRQLLLNEINKQIALSMRNVEETAINLSSNPELIDALTYIPDNTLEGFRVNREITRMLNHFVFSSTNFSSIRIYNDHLTENRVLPVETPLLPLSEYKWGDFEGKGKWMHKHEDLQVFSEGTEVLAYVHKLLNNRNEFVGYLKINVKTSYLFSYALEEGNGVKFIVDDQGTVVSEITQPIDTIHEALVPKAKLSKAQDYDHIEIDGVRYLTVFSNPNYVGWHVVESIPHRELFSNYNVVTRLLYFVSATGLLLSFVVSFVLSRKITDFVSGLLVGFRQVETGSFDLPRNRSAIVEIQQLQHGFHRMARKLDLLLRRLEDEHRERTYAEVNAHLAQINPHFLYNTLDEIRWTIAQNRNDEASAMIAKLSRLFRIGLSCGKPFILLGEELEHGQLYFDLQKERYKNHVRFDIEVPVSLRTLYVPRIMLQPFIENSFVHGFQKHAHTEVNPMRIRVAASVDGGILTITVENDGNDLQAGRSKRAGRETGGYGINNVRERIQLHFGRSYGVSLTDRSPNGVRVSIRLPAVTDMDNLDDNASVG